MKYRPVILVSALVLLALGLWFSATHAVDYLKLTNFVNAEGSWRDSDGDGYLELNICSKNGCSRWVDVQNEYTARFVADAIIAGAGASALLILFLMRKHTKAKSII